MADDKPVPTKLPPLPQRTDLDVQREPLRKDAEGNLVTTKDDFALAAATPLPGEEDRVVPGLAVYDWHRDEDRWREIVTYVASGQEPTVAFNSRELAEAKRLEEARRRLPRGGFLERGGSRSYRDSVEYQAIVLRHLGMHGRADVRARRGLEFAGGVLSAMGVRTEMPRLGQGPTRSSFREAYDLLTDGGENDPNIRALMDVPEGERLPDPQTIGKALHPREDFPGANYTGTTVEGDVQTRHFETPDKLEGEDGELHPELEIDVSRMTIEALKARTQPPEPDAEPEKIPEHLLGWVAGKEQLPSGS